MELQSFELKVLSSQFSVPTRRRKRWGADTATRLFGLWGGGLEKEEERTRRHPELIASEIRLCKSENKFKVLSSVL